MTRQGASLGGFGVRARTTLLAAVVVFFVLTIAGGGIFVAVRSALRQSIEATVIARSVDIASQVSGGELSNPIPLIRGISVQIVRGGTVEASTGDIEGQGAIVASPVTAGSTAVTTVSSLDAAENFFDGDDGEGPYIVAITGVADGPDVATVVAAGSLAGVRSATTALLPLLLIGIPAITLLVAALVWNLTKRAFRPVDAMAQAADAISYSNLHLRIAEPVPDDEIRHLAVVLNRMLSRLESSVTRQRRFTADAGHELRSPVASLLTMAEVAEANPTSYDVAELASDVAGQSRRLAALVEDLLLLARADEAGLALNLEPFDVADIISEEVASSRSPRVTIDTSGVVSIRVIADRRRIGQAVRNLLDNAIRHAHETINIETVSDHDNVLIVVSDDGSGIPGPDRQRIFERFIRLDESRNREVGGTGLGLAVVRSIVEAHGGTATVDDSHLGGAAVSISLPTSEQP